METKISAKKLNNTVKQVMVTNELGKPMYLKEAVSIFARPTLTENINEALVWGLLDGSKLKYNSILVGVKELTFQKLN